MSTYIPEGIALKLIPSWSEKLKQMIDPVSNVFLHQEILETKGWVFFSSDIPVSQKHAETIEYLLLYDNTHLAYLADVSRVYTAPKRTENGLMKPAYADLYEPYAFHGEEKKTWYVLTSLRPVSEAELDNIIVQSNDCYSVVEEMQQNRTNRFYFYLAA